ncbi:MAG: zinc ABC transporter substrate-binding protein [Candidatus Omnitrophica bacterium]|nr:zinc ABC transporter substrate-binding protein [Candidatus Omnitrophota bacterium]
MKKIALSLLFVITASSFCLCNAFCEGASQLKVVTTLPDYAFITKEIGKDRVTVAAIVRGDQDAHFIRPKPSFVTLLRDADLLVATGLDLELWLPTIVNKCGNSHIRSGQKGYVSAAHEMNLLEKPVTVSRIEGGVHLYGNPHVTCSPINMKVAARNITTGLIKNDSQGKEIYQKNLENFLTKMDIRLFGEKLVSILGGGTLCDLAQKGRLIPFLKEQEYQGKPLIDYVGGWMKKMLPLRGKPIVTYHKNWIYFVNIFGIEEAGTIEPKPGIPPSPRHVTNIVELMRDRDIRVILAANYFDEQKIRTVARKVNASPVIVPLYVGGREGVDDYFQLIDYWVDELCNVYNR